MGQREGERESNKQKVLSRGSFFDGNREGKKVENHFVKSDKKHTNHTNTYFLLQTDSPKYKTLGHEKLYNILVSNAVHGGYVPKKLQFMYTKTHILGLNHTKHVCYPS